MNSQRNCWECLRKSTPRWKLFVLSGVTKNHDKYPFDMMYYLRRSHAKNVAKFFSWDDNYYFKIDIKKYPIGSDECMEAIRNSKIKLGEDYYYDDE